MNLAGLHDKESVALGITGTWALDTIALSENPTPPVYDPAYDWIGRLNWGYGSTGTLPKPEGYPEYVRRACAFVRGSQNCHRWIVGNEPNLPREWPDNQPIAPWQYAECYLNARAAIRAMAGHEYDEVLIAASGPWNDQYKYPGNAIGDWVVYFADVIDACGNDCGGFSIHSYTHGYSVPLVTSSARMQAPFAHRHYEFRTYQDYLEAIPDSLAHLPIYLTEANGNGPWQAVGLMPAMLNEIDNWNKGNSRKVSAVIFYRYPRYDEFFIDTKQDVINEYEAAVGKGYTSPNRENNVTETFIPAVSPGATPTEPSLPPRIWDERLTARGVTVETPPIAPGQAFWRVVKAQWYDEQESGGRHHIYVEGPVNTPFLAVGKGSETPGVTNDKEGFDAANAPMWASEGKNGYSVWVDDGTPSETLEGGGMGADTPEGFNAGIHTSIGVTFQLVTMPAATTQPTTPTQPVTVEPKPPKETPVSSEIIEPKVAQAILKIESGGRSHGDDGRVLIRFEAHIFKTYLANDALWAQHFRTDPARGWVDQMWRPTTNDTWRPIHTGKQADEYAALDLAIDLCAKTPVLAGDPGYKSISMGAPQIMGFNHARIGYPSAAAMFASFHAAQLQTIGFINFCLSDPGLMDAMRRKDWREIARRYNGSGQVDYYAKLLSDAYASLG